MMHFHHLCGLAVFRREPRQCVVEASRSPRSIAVRIAVTSNMPASIPASIISLEAIPSNSRRRTWIYAALRRGFSHRSSRRARPRKTDDFPVPVTAALIGRFSGARGSVWAAGRSENADFRVFPFCSTDRSADVALNDELLGEACEPINPWTLTAPEVTHVVRRTATLDPELSPKIQAGGTTAQHEASSVR